MNIACVLNPIANMIIWYRNLETCRFSNRERIMYVIRSLVLYHITASVLCLYWCVLLLAGSCADVLKVPVLNKPLFSRILFFFCFSGNYYGTPRPIHIGPESPPITYQEHCKLLRSYRTRSKSLSNLEKAVEEGYNSEGDSGLSGREGRKDNSYMWVINS